MNVSSLSGLGGISSLFDLLQSQATKPTTGAAPASSSTPSSPLDSFLPSTPTDSTTSGVPANRDSLFLASLSATQADFSFQSNGFSGTGHVSDVTFNATLQQGGQQIQIQGEITQTVFQIDSSAASQGNSVNGASLKDITAQPTTPAQNGITPQLATSADSTLPVTTPTPVVHDPGAVETTGDQHHHHGGLSGLKSLINDLFSQLSKILGDLTSSVAKKPDEDRQPAQQSSTAISQVKQAA